MANRTHRLLFSFGALVSGIVIVIILTFLGAKSRGPLANLLDHAGTVVTHVENKIINENLTDKRKDRLQWFQPFLAEPEKFRNPGKMLLGVYDNLSVETFQNTFDLETGLKTTFPLIHIYIAWGSKEEEAFPKEKVNAIYELGSVPIITWEPWLSDFDAEKYPNLRSPDKRDKGGLRDIAAGKYDPYITAWATDAKNTNKSVFLRFGHEMNDPYRYPWGPQNNSAKDYVAAWRHVHKLFTALGATNVIWIWSPHPSYGWFDAFYPGDKYVDWVGVNILNYGTVASWSKWWSFKEMFGTHYEELAKYNKPLMITEYGCLSVGGDRKKWFEESLSELPKEFPKVKSVVFFHFSADNTTTQQVVDWTIKNDSASVTTIIQQIKNWPDSIRPPGIH